MSGVGLEGFFVAAVVVALVQFVRYREPRLVPLMLLFAALAAAESRESWSPWQDAWRLIAGALGLVLAMMLSRKPAERKS